MKIKSTNVYRKLTEIVSINFSIISKHLERIKMSSKTERVRDYQIKYIFFNLKVKYRNTDSH